MAVPSCIVCGNEAGNRRLQTREKMYGTLELFEYVQCGACGHLHLDTPVADLGAYYAKGYCIRATEKGKVITHLGKWKPAGRLQG